MMWDDDGVWGGGWAELGGSRGRGRAELEGNRGRQTVAACVMPSRERTPHRGRMQPCWAAEQMDLPPGCAVR